MHSFDVFDTSLVRTVAVPEDLFLLVAVSVLEKSGAELTTENVIEIARLRREAEVSARRARDTDDITLRDIYRRIDLPFGIDAGDMMQQELEVESSVVRAISSTKRDVETTRQQGEKVVFVSDTPLPTDHVSKMLLDVGLATDGDPVYASGDLGMAKWSGRLFDHVRQMEQPTGEWIHTGDHPQSDVRVPARKGIGTVRYRDAELTSSERILLQESLGEPWERSLIAGVSRAVRLSNADDALHPGLAEIVSGVVGPLLSSYVAWVLRDAAQTGIERLYFVSRDGDLLLQIVSELEGSLPGDTPDCRYLYGSRLAWLFPAITEMRRDDLGWLLHAEPTLGEALAKLHIDPENIAEVLHSHGFSGRDLDLRIGDDDRERFWRVIEDPAVGSMVLPIAAEAREATLAYLQQEGLMSSGRWALVDVGWLLRSKTALKQLLSMTGHGDVAFGYYLALGRPRAPMTDTGPFKAFALPEDDHRVDTLYSHAMVIEEAFLSAEHGTVIGYEWDGEEARPTLAPYAEDPRRIQYLRNLRRLLSAYVHEASKAGIYRDNLEGLRAGAIASCHDFLSNPKASLVESLAWMEAVETVSHEESRIRRLAVPLESRDIAAFVVEKTLPNIQSVQKRARVRRYFWPEGSLALSQPWVRWLWNTAEALQWRELLQLPKKAVRRILRALKRS